MPRGRDLLKIEIVDDDAVQGAPLDVPVADPPAVEPSFIVATVRVLRLWFSRRSRLQRQALVAVAAIVIVAVSVTVVVQARIAARNREVLAAAERERFERIAATPGGVLNLSNVSEPFWHTELGFYEGKRNPSSVLGVLEGGIAIVGGWDTEMASRIRFDTGETLYYERRASTSTVFAVDLTTGDLLWEQNVPGSLYCEDWQYVEGATHRSAVAQSALVCAISIPGAPTLWEIDFQFDPDSAEQVRVLAPTGEYVNTYWLQIQDPSRRHAAVTADGIEVGHYVTFYSPIRNYGAWDLIDLGYFPERDPLTGEVIFHTWLPSGHAIDESWRRTVIFDDIAGVHVFEDRTQGNWLIAEDAISGDELWRNELGLQWHAGIWADEDLIVVTTARRFAGQGGYWTAFDLQTGDVVWEFELEPRDESARWRVSCFSFDGGLFCVQNRHLWRMA